MLLKLDKHTLFLFPPDDAGDVPRYALQPASESSYDAFYTLHQDDELILQTGEEGTLVALQGVQLGTGSKQEVDEFKKYWDQCLESLNSLDGETVQPSFQKELKDREVEYIEQQPLKLRFVSWNLAGDQHYKTDVDLSELYQGDYDVLFVAFQEVVPLKAQNLRSSQVPVDNWVTKLMSIIGDEFEVLQTNKLLGLASILITKKDLASNFRSIEISSVGTGVLNLFGNKGAIATGFSIQDFHFTLLDCHFASGESNHFLIKRRRELDAINTYIKLPASNGELVSGDKSILFDMEEFQDDMKELELLESDGDEDIQEPMAQPVERPYPRKGNADHEKNIIFIGGDMNYRLQCSAETAMENIADHKYLLDFDSLKLEQSQGRILQKFHEGDIEFPPTYKVDKTTGKYEASRTPSYTDRIFHSESSYVKIDRYHSPEIILSDHRPVLTDYTIQLPLVNKPKRDAIVSSLLKQMDEQENTKRTQLEISDLETHIVTPILTPSTVKVKMVNVGNFKTFWEIMDSVGSVDSKVERSDIKTRIAPERGVLPRSGEQWINITTTLPIGCRSLTKTIILRGYSSQDYFLTVRWDAKQSYFGATLDELQGAGHGGIPQPIYSLINYLTGHLKKEMFNEKLLNFTQDLERKIIRWIDEDKELDQAELDKADAVLSGSSSIAISRVLLLLLRNLDGGIVSEDLSTYLLENFQDDDQVMERVLENLPPPRANVLIYVGSFLRLCVSEGFDKDHLTKLFEPLLLQVPQRRTRDLLLGRKNYDKLRREFMEILIN